MPKLGSETRQRFLTHMGKQRGGKGFTGEQFKSFNKDPEGFASSFEGFNMQAPASSPPPIYRRGAQPPIGGQQPPSSPPDLSGGGGTQPPPGGPQPPPPGGPQPPPGGPQPPIGGGPQPPPPGGPQPPPPGGPQPPIGGGQQPGPIAYMNGVGYNADGSVWQDPNQPGGQQPGGQQQPPPGGPQPPGGQQQPPGSPSGPVSINWDQLPANFRASFDAMTPEQQQQWIADNPQFTMPSPQPPGGGPPVGGVTQPPGATKPVIVPPGKTGGGDVNQAPFYDEDEAIRILKEDGYQAWTAYVQGSSGFAPGESSRFINGQQPGGQQPGGQQPGGQQPGGQQPGATKPSGTLDPSITGGGEVSQTPPPPGGTQPPPGGTQPPPGGSNPLDLPGPGDPGWEAYLSSLQQQNGNAGGNQPGGQGPIVIPNPVDVDAGGLVEAGLKTFDPVDPKWQSRGPGELPFNPAIQATQEALYRGLQAESEDPEMVNARTQSILGLQNLPLQQYYAEQFPGVFQGIQGDRETYKKRRDEDFVTPQLGFDSAFRVGASDPLNQALTSAKGLDTPDFSDINVPGELPSYATELDPIKRMAGLETELGLGSRAVSDVETSTAMTNAQALINALPGGQQVPAQPGGPPTTTSDYARAARPAFDESKYVTQGPRGPEISKADLERMETDRAQYDAQTTPYLESAMTTAGAMDPSDPRFAAGAKGENLSARVGDANKLSTDLITAKGRVGKMGQSEFTERALASGGGKPAWSIVGDLQSTVEPSDTTALTQARTAMGTRGQLGFAEAKEAMAADINESFRLQELKLEESMASRGILNSSMADEAREKLASEKSRALATSSMQAMQMAGSESRADAGQLNQFANDEMQRAIAQGDYARAGKIAEQQGRISEMGLNIQGAGAEDARREAQAAMGIRQQTALGGEQRANIGLSAQIAGQEFEQVMRGKQFEQSQAQAQQGAQAQQAGLQLQGGAQQEGARQFDAARGDATRQFQIEAGLQASAQQDLNARADQANRLQEQRINLDKSLGEAGLARQDVQMSSQLIEQRFQQDMASGEFDIQRSTFQLQRDLADQGMERSDIERVAKLAQQQWSNTMARAAFDSSEQQRILDSQMTALTTDENIYAQRAQLAGQPQSMMLSALSGTNVAPGVLGPMQMPSQSQGGGFGGAMGAIAGGLAGSFLGPMGTAVGTKIGGKI